MAKRRKRKSLGSCAGIKRGGKLKKGYRFKRGGGKCPVKAH